MHKEDKERVVTELTEKLRSSETMIVAELRSFSVSSVTTRSLSSLCIAPPSCAKSARLAASRFR